MAPFSFLIVICAFSFVGYPGEVFINSIDLFKEQLLILTFSIDSIFNFIDFYSNFYHVWCLHVWGQLTLGPSPVLQCRGEGHFPPAPPRCGRAGRGKSDLSRLCSPGILGAHDLDLMGPCAHQSLGHRGHLPGVRREFELWEHHPSTHL